MEEHRSILLAAEAGQLPNTVDESSDINMDVFEELIQSGLIDGADACSDDGRCYLDPKITLVGREYLENLSKNKVSWWHSFDRRIAVIGLVVAVLGLAFAVFVN